MTSSRERHTLFNRLVKPHFERLYKAAFHLTGNRTDCEDLLQDVFIKLYRRVDDLETVSPLEPWLMTVLHNAYVDSYRKHSKRAQRELMSGLLGETGFEYIVDAQSMSNVGDIDRLAEFQAIAVALKTLSAEHRAVIVLHDVIGHTLEEMQTIPLGALLALLKRNPMTLRSYMVLKLREKFMVI